MEEFKVGDEIIINFNMLSEYNNSNGIIIRNNTPFHHKDVYWVKIGESEIYVHKNYIRHKPKLDELISEGELLRELVKQSKEVVKKSQELITKQQEIIDKMIKAIG